MDLSACCKPFRRRLAALQTGHDHTGGDVAFQRAQAVVRRGVGRLQLQIVANDRQRVRLSIGPNADAT